VPQCTVSCLRPDRHFDRDHVARMSPDLARDCLAQRIETDRKVSHRSSDAAGGDDPLSAKVAALWIQAARRAHQDPRRAACGKVGREFGRHRRALRSCEVRSG